MGELMADFLGSKNEWRDSFFGPLANNRWGMFWSGWICAGIFSSWFDGTRIGVVGLIAIAILYARGTVSVRKRSDQSSDETSSLASNLRPPGKFNSLPNAVRTVALWLCLTLLFLVLFKYLG